MWGEVVNVDSMDSYSGTGQGTDLNGLIERCAAGDHSALREIFDSEAGRMKAVALRVLNRNDLADDALQDAFVQVWQNAGRFRPGPASPRAWLYTIVRFRAIDLLRSRAQEHPVAPSDLERMRDEATDQAFDTLDPNGRLFICLSGIEPRQRKAILLAYVAGLTQAEIAGRWSTPIGTIKSWMRRGLLALKECLG